MFGNVSCVRDNGALTLGVGSRFRKNTLSNIWLMTHSGDDATVYARHTFKWVADDLGCPRLSNTVSQSQVQRYFRECRCLTIIHPQIEVYLSYLSSIRQNNSRNLSFNLLKRSVNVLYLNNDLFPSWLLSPFSRCWPILPTNELFSFNDNKI